MTCKFIKPDGTECQARAIRGSELCFTHNPDYANQKALAVSKGGMGKRLYDSYGDPPVLQTPQDVKKLIGDTISLIWTGRMPASQPANSIGFLARVFLDAHEQAEMESRITSLEERLTKAGM